MLIVSSWLIVCWVRPFSYWFSTCWICPFLVEGCQNLFSLWELGRFSGGKTHKGWVWPPKTKLPGVFNSQACPHWASTVHQLQFRFSSATLETAVLWAHFSDTSKNHWFFSLFSFLLVRTEWWLLYSLYDRTEIKITSEFFISVIILFDSGISMWLYFIIFTFLLKSLFDESLLSYFPLFFKAWFL